MIVGLISILITLAIVIGLHEAAHFLMARLLGVKVIRFSIGFGKVIWRFKDKRQTEYALSLIPLGGYVQMLESTTHPQAFQTQRFYKKCCIIAAGPLMNFVVALILYSAIFNWGFMALKPMIGEITPQSIAADAGMPPRSEIISVDDVQTSSWPAIMLRLFMRMGDKGPVNIDVIKDKRISHHKLEITHWKMDKLKPDPLMSLGILPLIEKQQIHHVQYPLGSAIKHAFQQVTALIHFNLLLFKKLIFGQLSMQSLGGPISIFENANSAFKNGAISFMAFLAFLNIAIGVLNLLPIPGLDGGHLFFECLAKIRGKAISARTLLFCYRIGFICLAVIIFQALLNDLLRLFF